MMRGFLIAMVALSSQAALADDATQFFDSLYGNRIKQVKASLDRADDLALARDILTAAKTLERIDVLAVMCDQIVELSQRSAEGAPIAIEAWDLLAQKVEPRRAEARKKLAELLTRQASSSDAKVRQKAADDLIALHMQQGDEAGQAHKYDEASASYRQAMSAAQRFKSPLFDSIKAKVEAAGAQDRALKQITRLREKMLANANDSASAEEIIKLYVVELDNPAEAVKFLDRAKDVKLKKLVPMAAQPQFNATDADAGALGEWYVELAAGANGATKEAMWRRAWSHLTRFVDSQSGDPLARTKAALQLKTVSDSLAAIDAEREKIALRNGPETWISKDATYKISSDQGYAPTASFLTGGTSFHNGEFAFHTRENMAGGSVTIDLGKPKQIIRLWIENRRNQCHERAKDMTVSLAMQAGDKGKVIWVAEKVAADWTIELPRKMEARYIIIRQAEKNTQALHLTQLKVFGWDE